MGPEELAKLKVSLSKKKKARATMIATKKARSMSAYPKNVPTERAPEAIAKVVLKTTALPSPPTLMLSLL